MYVRTLNIVVIINGDEKRLVKTMVYTSRFRMAVGCRDMAKCLINTIINIKF